MSNYPPGLAQAPPFDELKDQIAKRLKQKKEHLR